MRREGVDPQRDPRSCGRIAESVAREHDERSLTGAVAPVPDIDAVVGSLVARVSDFGPLQPFLDDPSVEEFVQIHDLRKAPLLRPNALSSEVPVAVPAPRHPSAERGGGHPHDYAQQPDPVGLLQRRHLQGRREGFRRRAGRHTASHDLRHHFASVLLEEGVPTNVVDRSTSGTAAVVWWRPPAGI